MDNFNLKNWLIDNKVGNFGKALIKESIQNEADETEFNASDFPVTENNSNSTEVHIEEWEVVILGKDYIIDADVDVDFHYEDDDYVDHMITSPGGYFVDSAVATITKLGILEGDDYRYITDPAHIKQIQELINKDPKLNRELEDTAADYIEWDSVDDIDTYEGPDMEEANEQIGVGYVMKTKPSDPKY